MNLLDQVRVLLDRAVGETRDPRLAEARRRIDEPLRVAIAGKVKAGKSTLLNALVGEELAATDAGECTRIVTWYADGPTYAVTAHLVDGSAEPRPFTRRDGAVHDTKNHCSTPWRGHDEASIVARILINAKDEYRLSLSASLI